MPRPNVGAQTLCFAEMFKNIKSTLVPGGPTRAANTMAKSLYSQDEYISLLHHVISGDRRDKRTSLSPDDPGRTNDGTAQSGFTTVCHCDHHCGVISPHLW